MKNVKIAVTVPLTHADIVRNAIGEAGFGVIGNYSHCSFSVKGIGRSKPMDGANPTIGEIGKIEEIEEERIEFVCPQDRAKEAISIIKKVHPYEELALDIYPLLSEEDLDGN